MWLAVAAIVAPGLLLSVGSILLALYVLSAPGCSAATDAGRLAHRVVGAAIVVVIVATWVAIAFAIGRPKATAIRLVLAALPMLLVPLIVVTGESLLDARLDAVGDGGSGGSCF